MAAARPLVRTWKCTKCRYEHKSLNISQTRFKAWEAYWLAWEYRGAGVVRPEWVSSYFERVASQMIALSRLEPAGNRLVATRKFAKNGSVGHPYEFLRTVRSLSGF